LFLGDVFCRRVLVSFDRLQLLVDRWMRRTQRASTTDASRMERLRKSKSSATAPFTSSDGTTRYEPTPDGIALAAMVVEESGVKPATVDSAAHAAAEASPAPDETTSPEFATRLLEAKRRVRDNLERH
jgi:hypothetical protein